MPRSALALAAFALALIGLLSSTTVGWAAGGTETSAEDRAAQAYKAGLRKRDQGLKLEARAAEADDPRKKNKLRSKAQKRFEQAARSFGLAIDRESEMYQAHSSLGFALRKLGRFDESLAAYDQALRIEPDYPEALEYRAQAYLGLGRLEEAKEAYMALFADHRDYADLLMTAMQTWVAEQQAAPGAVDPDTLASFTQWLESRSELASQTAGLGAPSRTW